VRIERVALRLIELPLKEPFRTSFGVLRTRRMVLVHVTAEGAHGWGEVSALNDPIYNYETPETAWYILRQYLVPRVTGLTINEPTELPLLFADIRGHPFAKAGLENAAWELLLGRVACRSRSC
jgi:O-succinylbenzoate synthase